MEGASLMKHQELLKINQARHSSHKFKANLATSLAQQLFNNTQKFYHHSHNSIRDHNTSVILGQSSSCSMSHKAVISQYCQKVSFPLTRDDLIILHFIESLDIM